MMTPFLVGGLLELFLGKPREKKIVLPRSNFHGGGDDKYYSNDAMLKLSADHPDLMKGLDPREREELFEYLREAGSKDGVTIEELGSKLAEIYRSRGKSMRGELDKREIGAIANKLLPRWARDKYFGSRHVDDD